MYIDSDRITPSPVGIIVLDLDGTLLNNQKQISRANYASLECMAANGFHIIPSTGRFYTGMPQTVRNLPFVRYAITVNGAQIYDAKEDLVLHTEEIDYQQADAVFAVLDTMPVIYDCYQDGWGWMDRKLYDTAEQYITNPFNLDMVHRLRTPVDNFRAVMRERGRGIQKIQIFFADMELRALALPTLQKQFPELNITSSIANNIEINSAHAHKGAALAELCSQLGIDIGNTMAFGDGLNDISMLQVAGIGVAMANAEPVVKAAADYITDTNDRDGVARAIAHLYPDIAGCIQLEE